MINLLIDIGNTRTKVALFKQGKVIDNYSTDTLTVKDIALLCKERPNLQKAIVSTVRNDSVELIDYLKICIDYVIELNHTTLLPIENHYQTPETLGKDRIAAAVGANYLFRNQNILVIDAGTCITYDFVNAHNQYLGGFISLGLEMRYKALFHFTDKLPLLKSNLPEDYQGKNTTESIKGGIQYGLEGELLNMIQKFTQKKEELKIILTGGDKNYFEKLLKNHNFASSEVTILGLNIILEYNYQSFNKIRN